MLEDLPLRDMAHAIRDSALAKALRDRRAYAGDETLLALDLRRPAVLESIKDGLAQGVARALAAWEPEVVAIYAYDPSADPDNQAAEDRPFDAVLHLLVVVTDSAPALSTKVRTLDQALAESLREVPELGFQACDSVLDVMPLTQAEAQRRAGYGALLTTLYAPAIEIWRR